MAALLAVRATGCNSSSPQAASTKPGCGHKLAFFGVLTGSAGNLGSTIRQGAELAVDQYNAKNGADCITLENADSQGDPAVAPGLARQLVSDRDVLGVIGPVSSGESLEANPIFDQAGIRGIPGIPGHHAFRDGHRTMAPGLAICCVQVFLSRLGTPARKASRTPST